MNSLNESGIYQDLINSLIDKGCYVSIVRPSERKNGETQEHKVLQHYEIIKVRTPNFRGRTNFIEKTLATVLFDCLFLRAIKSRLNTRKYDIVVYPTPPITYTRCVSYIKQRDSCKSYLLLKDIFPQNAVDLGAMKKKGILYKYFRKKEKKLYKISDKIGVMSAANKRYLINENPSIYPSKVEINPNAVEITDVKCLNNIRKLQIREIYNVPNDKVVFVYGGNLGKPQGTQYLMNLMSQCAHPKAHFLIVGGGTEFDAIKKYIKTRGVKNIQLLSSLGKDEYEDLLSSCDVGIISLHPSFTFPNYPSRLLSYLKFKKPVLAVTDCATDIGNDIESNHCGVALTHDCQGKFGRVVGQFADMSFGERLKLGQNGRNWLERSFDVSKSANQIINAFTKMTVR